MIQSPFHLFPDFLLPVTFVPPRPEFLNSEQNANYVAKGGPDGTFNQHPSPCNIVVPGRKVAPDWKAAMLLNVVENFKKYTLNSLPTLLEKLAYISSLQSAEGRYRHWGLSRIFGDHRAQKGIATLHSELAMELIRIPIRKVYSEYFTATQRPGHFELLKPESLALKAPFNGDELLSAHLRLVQGSLVSVAGQELASHRAS